MRWRRMAVLMSLFVRLLPQPDAWGATQSAPTKPLDRAALASQVREEFLRAWKGYKKYAWGHDELKPVSKTAKDWYGQSLLITPVDALDTMLLMGLNDEAAEAKTLIVQKLSF